MAISYKKIVTDVTSGHGNKDGDTIYCYNLCGQSLPTNGDQKEILEASRQGYEPGICLSNLERVYAALLECINNEDSTKFYAVLTSNFIYEKGPESTSFTEDSQSTDSVRSRAFTCKVRPNVEAMLMGDIGNLHRLLKALNEKKSTQLYSAFENALKPTDLNNPALFKWDSSIYTRAMQELDKLDSYAALLSRDTRKIMRIKGGVAKEVGCELRTMLEKQQPRDDYDSVGIFNLLEFKLNLTQKLHTLDHEFAMHTRWDRFVTDLFTIFFGLNYANYKKYLVTSHGLFSNKNTAHEKPLDSQETVGFHQR